MKKFIICAICAICGFTTANAQGKFGHVNTQEIMQAMPEYTKAESEIKAFTAGQHQAASPAGAAGDVSEDPAELPGQQSGSSESFIREDAGYHCQDS